MRFKKLASAIAALAVGVSCFAGMTTPAGAAGNSENATVVAQQTWYSNNGTLTVNNTGIQGGAGPSHDSTNYPGIGAVKLSFENTDNLTVSKATLTYKVQHTQSNKVNNAGGYAVFSAGKPTADFSMIPFYSTAADANDGIFSNTEKDSNWTYSGILGDLKEIARDTNITYNAKTATIDVTDYVSSLTKQSDNKYYAVFAFSTPKNCGSQRGVIAKDCAMTIEYVSSSAVQKDITINYVYGSENTDIPAASLPTDTVTSDKAYNGTSYTATYKTTFDAVENGTTYRYTYAGVSGDDTITVSETGDNVITLKYNRAEVQYHDIVVNAVDSANDTLKELLNKTNVEVGVSETVSYPKYLTDESNKVTYSCNETTYAKNVSESTNIVYTAYTGNTMYFYEGEGPSLVGGTHDRLSNIGYLSGGKGGQVGVTERKITINEDGVYTIVAYAYNRNTNNSDTYLNIYKNSTTNEVLKTSDKLDKSYKELKEVKAENVKLSVGDTVILVGSGNNGGNACVDYVLLEKQTPAITATKSVTGVTAPSIETGTNIAVFDEAKDNFTAETTTPTLPGEVTTVYVKVEGVADADLTTVPTITINGTDYTSHKAAADLVTEINGSKYFIYQFSGIDVPDGATVTCGSLETTI